MKNKSDQYYKSQAIGKLIFTGILIVVIIATTFWSKLRPSFTKKNQTAVNNPTVDQSKTNPFSEDKKLIDYDVSNFISIGNKIYWLNQWGLESFNLIDNKMSSANFPNASAQYGIVSIKNIINGNQLLLEMRNYSKKQNYFVLFDLSSNNIVKQYKSNLKDIVISPLNNLLARNAVNNLPGDIVLIAPSGKLISKIKKPNKPEAKPIMYQGDRLYYIAKNEQGIALYNSDSNNSESIVSNNIQSYRVSTDGRFLAIKDSEGLKLVNLSTEKIQTISLKPDFFNWSNQKLIYGETENGNKTINSFDTSNSTRSKLYSPKLKEVNLEIQNAIFDEINKRIIYQYDDFVFSAKID